MSVDSFAGGRGEAKDSNGVDLGAGFRVIYTWEYNIPMVDWGCLFADDRGWRKVHGMGSRDGKEWEGPWKEERSGNYRSVDREQDELHAMNFNFG